jgi:dihydrofolate synthase/folylpolyglutamate synthase
MINFGSTEEIKNYFLTFAPKTWGQKYKSSWGLDNVKAFLQEIDNPQNKYKSIHIAGTSGKGSTAYFCSYVLASQNLKVGLHISPYVGDFREQFQINNKFLDLEIFLSYSSEFKDLFEKWLSKGNDPLSYYELIVCLSFFIFFKEKVDYAVVEVSLGGLFDSTNVINRKDKICLINSIGYDHTEILGKEITQIAAQKAGIILPQNQVFVIEQEFIETEKVFTDTASTQKAKINWVRGFSSDKTLDENIYFQQSSSDQNGNKFKLLSSDFEDLEAEISTLGDFQIRNTALALAGCLFVFRRDSILVDLKNLKKSLRQVQIPARMQVLKPKKVLFKDQINEQKVILDGAHNLQKVNNLVNSMQKIFVDQKFVILCGFSSANQNISEILKAFSAISDQIIITEYDSRVSKTVGKSTQKLVEITKLILDLKLPVTIESNFEKALSLSLANRENPVLITGSFYLISNFLKVVKFLD